MSLWICHLTEWLFILMRFLRRPPMLATDIIVCCPFERRLSLRMTTLAATTSWVTTQKRIHAFCCMKNSFVYSTSAATVARFWRMPYAATFVCIFMDIEIEYLSESMSMSAAWYDNFSSDLSHTSLQNATFLWLIEYKLVGKMELHD